MLRFCAGGVEDAEGPPGAFVLCGLFDVAELRLVVSRAMERCRLEKRVRELEERLAVCPESGVGKPLKQAVADYERSLINHALRRTGGIQTRAAEELGTTRRILRYRIEKLNIVRPR